MINCLENTSYKERVKELSVFGLERRRLKGDSTSLKYVKGALGGMVISCAPCPLVGGGEENWLSLQRGRFRQEISEDFLPVRKFSARPGCPGSLWNPHRSRFVKNRLDKHLWCSTESRRIHHSPWELFPVVTHPHS